MSGVNFTQFQRHIAKVVRSFYDPEPTNDSTSKSPIWLLGKEYKAISKSAESSWQDIQSVPADAAKDLPLAAPSESQASSVDSALAYGETEGDENRGWPPAFLDDFESKLWMTYRRDFPLIEKSRDPEALASMSFSVRLKSFAEPGGFSSDTNWGCMIRSGQSLLANTLVMLRMGREWRRSPSDIEERKIISLFADDPRAPFSIHKFVEHGASACGKHPGSWFGPSATARCIQALTNNQESPELRVYITGDGLEVYEDSFMSVARPDGVTFHPTLILVGTRLGTDKINPVYEEALKSSLQMPQSVGIAGGQPSSSHYFIGVQGPNFFYLDPHFTRPALPLPSDPKDYTQEDIDSCHTRRLRRIHIKDMDPSMLIGFLIRDENDWKEWRQSTQEVQGKAVIRVANQDPALHGQVEREGAIDEVETFDDSDDDDTMTT